METESQQCPKTAPDLRLCIYFFNLSISSMFALAAKVHRFVIRRVFLSVWLSARGMAEIFWDHLT